MKHQHKTKMKISNVLKTGIITLAVMALSNCVNHYDANSVYERKCPSCDGKGYQEGFGGGYWKTRCVRCDGTGIDSKTGAQLNNEEHKFIFNDFLRTLSGRSGPR